MPHDESLGTIWKQDDHLWPDMYRAETFLDFWGVVEARLGFEVPIPVVTYLYCTTKWFWLAWCSEDTEERFTLQVDDPEQFAECMGIQSTWAMEVPVKQAPLLDALQVWTKR